MNWSTRARAAAIDLSTGEERQDDSVTALLIRDIYTVFSENGGERLQTADLLVRLYEIEESPWGDWHGKPLSGHSLSRLLRPYRIKTMTVRVDGETARGYKLEQFSDAFARSSVTSVTGVTSQASSHAERNACNACNASGSELGGNGRNPLPGDPGYLEWLLPKFEAGHLTEGEWRQLEGAHRLVVGRTSAP